MAAPHYIFFSQASSLPGKILGANANANSNTNANANYY